MNLLHRKVERKTYVHKINIYTCMYVSMYTPYSVCMYNITTDSNRTYQFNTHTYVRTYMRTYMIVHTRAHPYVRKIVKPFVLSSARTETVGLAVTAAGKALAVQH